MDQRIDLRELLRDPSDIEDFLGAYGEQVPEAPRTARKRALDLLETLGPTGAVGVLFGFARAFARMAGEVADFCREYGAALGGQIRLPQDKLLLNVAGLQTGWALSSPALDIVDLDARAHALAAALASLASRLHPEDLIQHFVEEQVTAFGRNLQNSDNLTYRAMWRQFAGATRKVEHVVCSAADLHAVSLATEIMEETSGALERVPLSAGTVTALQDVNERLRVLLQELEQQEVDDQREVTPWVAGLADELQLLSGQLRQLGEEVTQGERVRRGFHDFLRTEFWSARWRIYELWLLVRVLRTIERAGGRVSLASMEDDVWAVPYGRAQKPVATASFPAGELDVYYQYWRESEQGADMPDLVILERSGHGLAVIDPKHGLSYTRSKVQGVLTRYARQLEADVTAVVNYFPIRAYPFEYVREKTRAWILASDVAPDTNHGRRLELHLEDALRGRGFYVTAPEAGVPARPTPAPHRAPQEADLGYWATRAREVDEPAGLWCARAGGETVPIDHFAEKWSESHGAVLLEATRDGKACVLLKEPQAFVVRAGQSPKTLANWKYEAFTPYVGWDLAGEHFVFAGLDGDRVFDRDGLNRGSLPVASAQVVGWDPEGRGLYCVKGGKGAHGSLLSLLLVELDGSVAWEVALPGNDRLFFSFDRERWSVQPGFAGRDPIVDLCRYGAYLVRRDGKITEVSGQDLPLSVSPSGRHAVLKGPDSYKHSEARVLLEVRDGNAPDRKLPLVRYTGELPVRIRWSPDETRFAFISKATMEEPARLFAVRLGERHARAISLPEQEPSGFAWVWPGLWT